MPEELLDARLVSARAEPQTLRRLSLPRNVSYGGNVQCCLEKWL